MRKSSYVNRTNDKTLSQTFYEWQTKEAGINRSWLESCATRRMRIERGRSLSQSTYNSDRPLETVDRCRCKSRHGDHAPSTIGRAVADLVCMLSVKVHILCLVVCSHSGTFRWCCWRGNGRLRWRAAARLCWSRLNRRHWRRSTWQLWLARWPLGNV